MNIDDRSPPSRRERSSGLTAPDHAVVLDNMGDAVLTTDPAFRITSWNRAAVEIYGWTAEEVRGRSVAEVLRTTWDSEEDRARTISQLAAEGRWRGEADQLTRDGRAVRVFSVVTLLRDAEGSVLGIVAVNRDVTRERAAEAALREVETRLTEAHRTDVLGQLAGSVAHDFNNLLAVVGGHAEIALGLLPPEHPARRPLLKVTASVDRGATLARQLLSFGRRDQLDAVLLDVGEMVRGIDEVLRRAVGSGHRLDLTLPDGPVWARASRGELELVLINLCHNARDALAESGVVAITVRPDATGVVIEVADTGEGMSPEVRARAFDAFFSTRPPGRGTGLGLTVVARVLARYGGSVALDSAPGQGTRVTLTLPAVEAPVVDAPAAGEGVVRGARVLLAEDQELVREVLAHMLRALGHEVLLAADGLEALDMARREPFDVLVTDVSMPRMGGPALAAALRAEAREVPVVYVSGFPRDEASERAEGWPPGVFRSKPLRREALRSALEEALGGLPIRG